MSLACELLVLLLLAVTAAPVEAAPPDPWMEVLSYEHARVRAARQAFEHALERDPGDGGALAGLAATLAIGARFTWERDPGTVERADSLSRRAAEAEPDRTETQFARSQADLLLLDFGSAEARARAALDLRGPPGAAALALGESLLAQGRWTEAERSFRDALEALPASCPAGAGLADSLRQQARYGEAIDLATEVIAATPGCYPAHLTRATAVFRAGRQGSALRLQRSLFEAFPESRDLTLLNSAAMVLARGESRTALLTYRRIDLGAAPPYLRLLRDLGEAECSLRLGEGMDPKGGMQRFIQEFPATTGGEHLRARLLFPAYRSLAEAHRAEGSTGAEIALLDAAAREPDVPARLLERLAEAYAEIGLSESAGAALEAAVRGGRFDSIHEQGEILRLWLRGLRPGRGAGRRSALADHAVEEFRKRVENEGAYASFYALARVLALTDRGREAFRWLERSVRTGFRNSESLRREPDLEPVRRLRGFRRLLGELESGSPPPS